MKATIRRPDGTTIEAEGTADELARLAGVTPAPLHVPSIPWLPTYPWSPPPMFPSPYIGDRPGGWFPNTGGAIWVVDQGSLPTYSVQ